MRKHYIIIPALAAVLCIAPLVASAVERADYIPFKYTCIIAAGETANPALSLRRSETVSKGPVLNQAPGARIGKSGKTFLRSVLIPGWSQYQQGRKKTAMMFIGAELALWSGLFGVQTYGGWLENDYKAYALQYADIDPAGKDHDFYVDIGNYDSVDDFNDVRQRNRQYDGLYLGDDYYWQWESESRRLAFKDLRISADQYKHSAIFFAGAIVLNHLVSAVEAVKNRPEDDDIKVGIDFNQQGNTMLTIIKGF